jgi:signal recognition particle subunit SRP54
MFESLSTRIQDVFKSLRGEVRLTPEHVETALREIRLALLEADVNFKVVKAFIDRVRDQAMDQTVLKSLSPGQQVIKIVRDEMLALFGDTEGGLRKDAPTPRVVLLLGLQGSGKTTTSGKLAMWLTRQGKHPLMVSTDVRRPAAIQQLSIVGQKADVKVYEPDTMDPVVRASGALAEAKAKGFDTVIVDTAGRLHIDDELMDELQAIKSAVQPSDLLYVADAMTGQDAIKSAGEFNRRGGALRCLGRRRADRVCRQRRAAHGSRAVSSRPNRVPDAGHGRRAVAHREGRGRNRSGRSGGSRREAAEKRVYAR